MADLVLEPLVLLCPACGRQHIDEGDLAVDPHVEHVCLDCGNVWRPREHATVGVPVGTLSGSWLFDVSVVHGDAVEEEIKQRWRDRETLTTHHPSSVATVPPPRTFAAAPVSRSFEYWERPGIGDSPSRVDRVGAHGLRRRP
jgi:hypothetical protein